MERRRNLHVEATSRLSARSITTSYSPDEAAPFFRPRPRPMQLLVLEFMYLSALCQAWIKGIEAHRHNYIRYSITCIALNSTGFHFSWILYRAFYRQFRKSLTKFTSPPSVGRPDRVCHALSSLLCRGDRCRGSGSVDSLQFSHKVGSPSLTGVRGHVLIREQRQSDSHFQSLHLLLTRHSFSWLLFLVSASIVTAA